MRACPTYVPPYCLARNCVSRSPAVIERVSFLMLHLGSKGKSRGYSPGLSIPPLLKKVVSYDHPNTSGFTTLWFRGDSNPLGTEEVAPRRRHNDDSIVPPVFSVLRICALPSTLSFVLTRSANCRASVVLLLIFEAVRRPRDCPEARILDLAATIDAAAVLAPI